MSILLANRKRVLRSMTVPPADIAPDTGGVDLRMRNEFVAGAEGRRSGADIADAPRTAHLFVGQMLKLANLALAVLERLSAQREPSHPSALQILSNSWPRARTEPAN